MTNDPSLPPAPTVAVVTVSYNSGRFLGEFLASVPAATAHPDVVLTVVADNASADPDAARLTTEAAGARFVEVGRNAGYGGAVNVATEGLPPSVRYVLVSNPDVVLAAGALDVLVATADADPRIGAVGPAIWEPTGEAYPSARSLPSLRTGLGHAVLADIWPGNPWTRRYHGPGPDQGDQTVGWLSGACLLVRRDAFDRLGGFDTSFFMYFEDVDLGWRLSRAGLRNVYQPRADVTHVGAHSTRNESVAMRREHHRSAYRFLSRKYAAWWLWPLRLALRVGLSLRARVQR
ncbi:glycosyltransferase family 2 protein [Frigoribacterium sp. VKM Ac-2836]|uniref:glycosyltransferase family 2 protein n=1 Tax=Frigoribacterium sp. VKM Ac-2836 TaxID=2739014 RepID=UPI001563A361|nr:glycosyltransferase family 2 protein [Frigoribacterium sp. VKM Ac-2836]NRD25415.1 glycosyltransferase family 2 protein [Frigoribacterium sp. VKM Ac-2836]